MSDRGIKEWKKREEGFVWAGSLGSIPEQSARHGSEAACTMAQEIPRSSPTIARGDVPNRGVRQPTNNAANRQPYKRADWTPELDEILRKGYAAGWSEKRRAVQQILKLRPRWLRHTVWRRALKLGLRNQIDGRHARRPPRWSQTEERILVDHAGYDSASAIAELLNRSLDAVRCRLSRLGASSRVSDGYTKTELASFLHVSPKVVQRWIALGWLNVRNPRISASSIQSFIDKHGEAAGLKERPEPSSTSRARTEYTWTKAAKYLSVERENVAEWVERGWLKCSDAHITEKSLEEFCAHHPSEIRCELLAPDALAWLRELGLPEQVEPKQTYDGRARCAHARKEWICEEGCRRRFRGNIYFKHKRKCAELRARHALGAKTAPKRWPTSMTGISVKSRENYV